jgi:uronate dehydrogenase
VARVAITGAAGTIGAVLLQGLDGHALTPLDLPGCDLLRADLARELRGHDAVVHLAWRSATESFHSKGFDPVNALMAHRVLEAAVAAGVGRVVAASSVHADRYRDLAGPEPLSPARTPEPDSPYGASKVLVEALGRYYAAHRGLEVVCIRFGGVTPRDTEPDDPGVWLRHADCVGAVRCAIEAPAVPGGFALFYAVSDLGAPPLVDTSNPFGWRPSR